MNNGLHRLLSEPEIGHVGNAAPGSFGGWRGVLVMIQDIQCAWFDACGPKTRLPARTKFDANAIPVDSRRVDRGYLEGPTHRRLVAGPWWVTYSVWKLSVTSETVFKSWIADLRFSDFRTIFAAATLVTNVHGDEPEYGGIVACDLLGLPRRTFSVGEHFDRDANPWIGGRFLKAATLLAARRTRDSRPQSAPL